MFLVNIYILEPMDHDPKRVTTQKRVTIFLVKDHDQKTGTDSEGSIFLPILEDRSPTLLPTNFTSLVLLLYLI
jgi:hypothetical protein